MKIKFNWGTGAFMLFGGFAIFMSCLAIFASQQSHELVTDDYYEKELEFKEVQKKQERTALLATETQMNIEDGKFNIKFPSEIEDEISGTVVFFKPSSQKDDQLIDFKTTSKEYKIDLIDYASGMYKVKIDWTANGVAYYNEGEIVIP